MLAVAVSDRREFASDPYYARVIAGAHEETARHGLSLCVHVAASRSLAGLTPFAGSQRHLGAILVNASAEEATFISGLSRPIVSMGAVAPAVPSADPENEAGVSAAVGHLLAQGRRRIAMIAGPQRNPCSRERLAGYRSSVRAAGVGELRLTADFTRPGAARAARRLLEAAPDIDAIFVASDLMATAVLQALIETGAGLCFPALMTLAMSSATPQDVGLASGLVNTTAQVGGALGLAVLATVSASRTNTLIAYGRPVAVALTDGYHLAFWIAFGLVIAAIAVAATVLRPQRGAAAPAADETRQQPTLAGATQAACAD